MAGPLRQPIDQSRLEHYLSTHVPSINVPVTITQFGFGQSNPTYLLTCPPPLSTKHVLRKKPPGKLVSTSAHAVEREYRILTALLPTPVPVPQTLCLCTDDSVLDTPFYIMSFLQGRIIQDPAMPGQAHPAQLWRAAVKTLATLHRVDARAVGLGDYGRFEGHFYARQARTFAKICEAQGRVRDRDTGRQVGALPYLTDMVGFFGAEERQPRWRATLVHGDYKIDNLVFDDAEDRVIGILDWEMSTIGHPLSDLANLLGPYIGAAFSNPSTTSNNIFLHPSFSPSSLPRSFPTATELKALYWQEMDRPPTPGSYELPAPPQTPAERARDFRFAEAFSLFRATAVCHGIAARRAAGQASSERAGAYAALVVPMAERAWAAVRGMMEKEEKGPKASL